MKAELDNQFRACRQGKATRPKACETLRSSEIVPWASKPTDRHSKRLPRQAFSVGLGVSTLRVGTGEGTRLQSEPGGQPRRLGDLYPSWSEDWRRSS